MNPRFRRGHNMTRVFKVISGVSVLVLAYAAQAAGGFQLSVANHFPPMCRIGTAPTYSLDTTATVTNSTTSSPTIDFGTNFSNSDATGRKMSGSVHFTVYANAECNYALTSAYGALKNITAGQTGTFRDYYADAYNLSGSGTLVHLNSLSSNALVSQFTIPAPIFWEMRLKGSRIPSAAFRKRRSSAKKILQSLQQLPTMRASACLTLPQRQAFPRTLRGQGLRA